MRFCVLALAIGLAGCAAGGVAQYLPDPSLKEDISPSLQGDLSEPNYRKIVADNLATVFPGTQLGMLEISGVRPVDHLRGPAWLTCLRIRANDAPQEYAVFIVGEKIIDSRAGVAIDRCKQQAYEPFDPALIQRSSALAQQKKPGR